MSTEPVFLSSSNTAPARLHIPDKASEWTTPKRSDASCRLIGRADVVEVEVRNRERGFHLEATAWRAPDAVDEPTLNALRAATTTARE